MTAMPQMKSAPDNRTLANALRMLAIDAVEQAKFGHPGAPMGLADTAEVLWNRYLKHNPADPRWPDRDRFILSNGHGSMLLYALLHLSGYDLPLDELKRFRQLHSKTPGHPEVGVTPGVETTTGPLGQGLANAVGMALAEKLLAEEFNRPTHTIVNHRTFVFVGDGCLMEGISHEVCSLAGTLGLEKLVAFYDDNGISIYGHVRGWFTDDTPSRFEAYGWRVIRDVDGHDPAAIESAIRTAFKTCGKPTLVCCKTVIGLAAERDWHLSPGDKVRAFNIKVPSFKKGGIFDRLHGSSSERARQSIDLIARLERGYSNNHGQIIPVWVTFLMRKDRSGQIINLVKKFTDQVGATRDGWGKTVRAQIRLGLCRHHSRYQSQSAPMVQESCS